MTFTTASVRRVGILWTVNAVMIAWQGQRMLAAPDQAWTVAGALLVGLLAWTSTARLVDRAVIVGVTAAVPATVLCAAMAHWGTGLGPMVGFVAGMSAGIAARRFRAAGMRVKA
jgi:hypothetical protein